ncbi:hypothetical protein [Paenibacillus periandrae]|uniref:hypothetical protein n=1 Tax=Paenibacillus periandrae TaxID=1761741 RepID=UPI001F09C352|nr:hypothetical protein [Paenibacillus periandrae]
MKPEEWLSSYRLPVRQEIVSIMEQRDPFQIQYSFVPEHPASLLHKVQLVHQEWMEQGTMKRFHAKALFYQFVYELL